MRGFVRRHSLLTFIFLACCLSWLDWIPLLIQGLGVIPGGPVTHFPGLLGPVVSAFIIVAITEGSPGVRRLFQRLTQISKPTGRFLAYSLSPILFLGFALSVMRLACLPIPPLRYFELYSGLPPLPLLMILVLAFLFNGYGEETGWRGFALERLQKRFGPVRVTLVLAVIWAGWHIPSLWLSLI